MAVISPHRSTRFHFLDLRVWFWSWRWTTAQGLWRSRWLSRYSVGRPLGSVLHLPVDQEDSVAVPVSP
jgi:hypothetical protein